MTLLYNRKAQSLMVAITILALLFIVAVAFFSLAQTERTASLRNLDVLRTHYIAEAGIAYGRAVVKSDREENLLDTLQDSWATHFSGNELDLDGDGKPETRWVMMQDSRGMPVGRFGVRILDEAGKLNINTCSSSSLEHLFSRLGVSSGEALLSHRPFNAVEEAGGHLAKTDFSLCKDYLTVYSRDKETTLARERRVYLNSYNSQDLLQGFVRGGVKDALQKCANLKDASDEDTAQTRFDMFVRKDMTPAFLSVSGSWEKKGAFYEAPSEGRSGTFTWSNLSMEDGEYFCYCFGVQDSDIVGEVSLGQEEISAELLFSGDCLTKKVKVAGGTFSLNIKPAKEGPSRFSRVELVSLSPRDGMSREVVCGTEALVINELMVKPWQELSLGGAVTLSPGQSTVHTFTLMRPGDYYVVVLAARAGQAVGDVSIHGNGASNLYDSQFFPYPVNSAGELTVEVRNNLATGTSFRGIQVRQQPDAEFIEVLNLSGQEIDLSNYSIEVYALANELSPGWPARVPPGVTIRPYEYLVLAMDSNDADAPKELKNNDISFQGIWHSRAVQLIFDEFSGSINKDYDLLPDTGASVMLKDSSGRLVDAVNYTQAQVQDFVSIERSDPSQKQDSDGDGAFDGWRYCEAREKATPGLCNENAGMYARDPANRLIKHTPAEISVYNRALKELIEAKQLSSGKSWEKFSVVDLSRMADQFSLDALCLNLSGHYVAGEFKESDGVFESTRKGDSGLWEFTMIPPAPYILEIVSDGFKSEGEGILVSCKTSSEEEFKDASLLLFSQGTARFGNVELKTDTGFLQVKIVNDADKKISLKSIMLEPAAEVFGRVNLNTAGQEVLSSVLPSDELVQAVLKARPIGIKDGLSLGVGQLFLTDENFIPVAQLFTTRSDIYEISCRGEYNPQGKTLAYQNIRTVVERGEEP